MHTFHVPRYSVFVAHSYPHLSQTCRKSWVLFIFEFIFLSPFSAVLRILLCAWEYVHIQTCTIAGFLDNFHCNCPVLLRTDYRYGIFALLRHRACISLLSVGAVSLRFLAVPVLCIQGRLCPFRCIPSIHPFVLHLFYSFHFLFYCCHNIVSLSC